MGRILIRSVTRMEDFSQREFPMTDEDFWALSKLAYEHTGIVLKEPKKNLVYGRLSRRIRALGLKSFHDYVRLIESGTHQEFDDFLNAITTNLTSFFREPHHFDFLEKQICKEFEHSQPSSIRIWSAGCSTGEEAYSIAMTLRSHCRLVDRVKILATDLDANVLQHGRAGIYEASRIADIEQAKLKRFFLRDRSTGNGQVKEELRNLVTFNRLNLLGEWPMKQLFDVIFCRNVLIYFDKDTQQKLVNRYAQQLKSSGYLFIGHSENISHIQNEFEFIGQTIYQKRN